MHLTNSLCLWDKNQSDEKKITQNRKLRICSNAISFRQRKVDNLAAMQFNSFLIVKMSYKVFMLMEAVICNKNNLVVFFKKKRKERNTVFLIYRGFLFTQQSIFDGSY